MSTVKEVIESKISPIVIDFSDVHFFDNETKIVRSFLTANTLDLGVLGYAQYRFVARRTKVGDQLVRRHLEKLFRMIPDILTKYPDVACFTVPVYARLLTDNLLLSMLMDMISLYPDVPPSKICIELSADILYEELSEASKSIDALRALGVRVAISEVGDQFCPVFRLSEFKFDYAFMDHYSTASLGTDDQERIAGSLVKYLHYLDARVVAPGLETDAKINGAKAIGADGYTTDVLLSDALIGGVEEDEE